MVKLGVGSDGSAGADLIERSGSSGSWMESLSSTRRRGFSSPSSSAFLIPAFDACIAAAHSSSSSGGSLDFGASFLRYMRYGHQFSLPDSHDFRSTSTRRGLPRQLKLRSSSCSLPSESAVGGFSSSSPLSAIDNVVQARPRVYMAPLKVEVGEDVMVMDGVLVSDAGSSNARDNCKTEFAHGKEELHSVHDVKHKPEECPYPLPISKWKVQVTFYITKHSGRHSYQIGISAGVVIILFHQLLMLLLEGLPKVLLQLLQIFSWIPWQTATNWPLVAFLH